MNSADVGVAPQTGEMRIPDDSEITKKRILHGISYVAFSASQIKSVGSLNDFVLENKKETFLKIYLLRLS